MMQTLFISDLHLSAATPHLTELFIQFMRESAPHADSVYILGDLFEYWIGDDDLTSYHQLIIAHLRDLARKIPVYLLTGNRDFLIGEQFAQLTGVKLLNEPHIVEVHGIRTLLLHGDSLCTHDKFYQYYRKIVRSPLFKKIFLTLPLSLRRVIADRMRKNSKKRNRNLNPEWMDTTLSVIPLLTQEFGVEQIIYGHTHKPAIHLFWQDNQVKQCIVLSDWHEQGNMLICNPNGQRLVYFDQDCQKLQLDF